MATSPIFLVPLGSFRKRIAYANVYNTDFPVPTKTAAFLCLHSRYPHHCFDLREGDRYSGVMLDDSNLIIATLCTPRTQTNQISMLSSFKSSTKKSQQDELLRMSMSLDSLGWIKVFVDMRRQIPVRISLPSFLERRHRSSVAAGGKGSAHLLCTLQRRGVVESRDVVKAFSTPNKRVIGLPLGHNTICAFSRSNMSKKVNKGGRPVMDALARELVDGMLSWNVSYDCL